MTVGLFTRERITFRKTFRIVIWLFPDLKAWFYPLWMQSSFKSGFWNAKKKGVLDRDLRRKPDSWTCERKALSKRDLCVCILEMRAEAMHESISADCAVGTKYYLAVRRSCLLIGKAFAIHVNAHNSNPDPDHEADRDPKLLSELDSLFCEHSL